jgi:hypothetical protein
MRRVSLVLLVIGVLCALGAGTAAPASADICAISSGGTGNYKTRSPDNSSGPCITQGTVGAEKYILVLDRGILVNSTEACAEVSETHKGNYANSRCTTSVAPGSGAFIAIVIKTNAFGRWWVEGKDTKELTAETQVTKLTTAKATLKAKVAGAEIKFTTSTAPELVGTKLTGEGGLASGATVKFKGVTTELNGKASSVCAPLATAGNDGTLGMITTNKLSGGLVLHEGGGVVQLQPETGTVMATLFFGAECSLPEKVNVITKEETGKGLVLTDPLGFGKETTEHEVVELSALTQLWLISETSEHKATLEGGAAVGLSGSHKGLKWKGKPAEFEVL